MKVAVVGGGVAGVAAAWAAAAKGASVRLFRARAGSSALTSGALDFRPWPEQVSWKQSSEAASFFRALALWKRAAAPQLLVTGAGIVRSAEAADRLLLNLADFRGARIAVADVDRDDWDAELLVRALSQSPFSATTKTSFEAVGVKLLVSGAERRIPPHDFASALALPERAGRVGEALRAVKGFDACLLGPWLGVTVEGAERVRRLSDVPIGETTSMPGGAAGARLQAALDALLQHAGVKVVDESVDVVERGVKRWDVRLHSGDNWRADAVVIAVGGFVSGGLRLAQAARQARAVPFELSVSAPLLLAPELGRTNVATLHGFDFEAAGLGCLEEVGATLPSPAPPGLALAGDIVCGSPKTMLHAIDSGLCAVGGLQQVD